MENWRTFQSRESLLANPEYVSGVLGIPIPLQESYPYSILLTEEILQEQLLLEGWIESVKGFVADKAKPYKDFFATLTQIVQDPEQLGSFLSIINKNLKNELSNFNIKNIDFEKCINNQEIEDKILNERITASKKFNIQSTPTVVINEKKFDKQLKYKYLKKAIEKLI